AKNRVEARRIMEKLGYSPDNRRLIKFHATNIPPTRDPAVLLTGQLKEIYIDGELERRHNCGVFREHRSVGFHRRKSATSGGSRGWRSIVRLPPSRVMRFLMRG